MCFGYFYLDETNSTNMKKGNLTMPPPPNIQFDDEESWSD